MAPRPRARREVIPGSRYELVARIGEGGTATVWLGRLRADLGGLARLVAVKRAHPHLARDPEARRLLLREAAVASRVNHANVVSVLDVDAPGEELLLVLDYVEGASLAELLEPGEDGAAPLPAPVALTILLDACAGLVAVHELDDDAGRPMGLLHRDVSPQNVLVGVDGTARITDFGLAKLAQDLSRASGTFAGKMAYLPPEHVDGGPYDARGEVFAAGVVTWEALAGRRLFRGAGDHDTRLRLLRGDAPRLSEAAPALGQALDAVVARALDPQPRCRYPSVRAFAAALEAAAREGGLLGSASEVAATVQRLAGPALADRRAAARTGAATSEGGGLARDAEVDHTRELVRADAGPAAGDATTTEAAPSVAERPASPARRRAAAALASLGAVAIVGFVIASPDAPAPAPPPRVGSALGVEVAPPPSPVAPTTAPMGGADAGRFAAIPDDPIVLDATDPPAPPTDVTPTPPRGARTRTAPSRPTRAPPDAPRGQRPPANPYK